MAGATETEHFIGNETEEFRGLLKIKYPMEHGIVTNWEDMERIWKFAYSELHVRPEDVSDSLFFSQTLPFSSTHHVGFDRYTYLYTPLPRISLQ